MAVPLPAQKYSTIVSHNNKSKYTTKFIIILQRFQISLSPYVRWYADLEMLYNSNEFLLCSWKNSSHKQTKKKKNHWQEN